MRWSGARLTLTTHKHTQCFTLVHVTLINTPIPVAQDAYPLAASLAVAALAVSLTVRVAGRK